MLLPRTITATEVHLAIQMANNSLLVADDAIAIGSIADRMQVDIHELLKHIDTLASLYYLQFADKKKERIRLTFNGKNTVVPLL